MSFFDDLRVRMEGFDNKRKSHVVGNIFQLTVDRLALYRDIAHLTALRNRCDVSSAEAWPFGASLNTRSPLAISRLLGQQLHRIGDQLLPACFTTTTRAIGLMPFRHLAAVQERCLADVS